MYVSYLKLSSLFHTVISKDFVHPNLGYDHERHYRTRIVSIKTTNSIQMQFL